MHYIYQYQSKIIILALNLLISTSISLNIITSALGNETPVQRILPLPENIETIFNDLKKMFTVRIQSDCGPLILSYEFDEVHNPLIGIFAAGLFIQIKNNFNTQQVEEKCNLGIVLLFPQWLLSAIKTLQMKLFVFH